MTVHRIDIDPKPEYRKRGDPLFTAYHEGKEICRSPEPFYASCRILLAMGLTGHLEMYGPWLRMSGDIEKNAGYTINNGSREAYRPDKFDALRERNADD